MLCCGGASRYEARPLPRHRFPDESTVTAPEPHIVLAEHRSPPWIDLLQVVDKVSQNLHAEILLREVAVASGHVGSVEAGLDAMDDFLAGIGISKADHEFTDGSGLSRATLVTPAAIAKLLASMNQSKYREQWLNLLPIGGEDGTLGSRFAGHPEARNIHAKTGTLDHVRALSGYVDTPAYGRVGVLVSGEQFRRAGRAGHDCSGSAGVGAAPLTSGRLTLAPV